MTSTRVSRDLHRVPGGQPHHPVQRIGVRGHPSAPAGSSFRRLSVVLLESGVRGATPVATARGHARLSYLPGNDLAGVGSYAAAAATSDRVVEAGDRCSDMAANVGKYRPAGATARVWHSSGAPRCSECGRSAACAVGSFGCTAWGTRRDLASAICPPCRVDGQVLAAARADGPPAVAAVRAGREERGAASGSAAAPSRHHNVRKNWTGRTLGGEGSPAHDLNSTPTR